MVHDQKQIVFCEHSGLLDNAVAIPPVNRAAMVAPTGYATLRHQPHRWPAVCGAPPRRRPKNSGWHDPARAVHELETGSKGAGQQLRTGHWHLHKARMVAAPA